MSKRVPIDGMTEMFFFLLNAFGDGVDICVFEGEVVLGCVLFEGFHACCGDDGCESADGLGYHSTQHSYMI